MNIKQEIKSSLLTSLWFILLTGPMLGVRVLSGGKVLYRWDSLIYLALAVFVLSFIWRQMLAHRDKSRPKQNSNDGTENLGASKTWVEKIYNFKHRNILLAAVLVIMLTFPIFGSLYQVSTMVTAFIYIVLGLGLNIVVGVSGLLNLGYAAFYAIGAYTYALLNHYFGWGFWICMPLGALTSTIFGFLLGFPVLRLRGDYLAIVTLAFGEIVRLILTNWSKVTMGPSGIKNIARPYFFGADLSVEGNMTYIYFIAFTLVILTIIAVYRLENSRLGRAWLAMREDEIACQAMGVDLTKTKLTAFALGATWAGLAGVVFASQVTFINPQSFTFMQSVMILCIVVLGGMGSIPGVILGAIVMILLPEYLRALSTYRMLIFGALMVLMMVFRPGGLIQSVRKAYIYKGSTSKNDNSKEVK